MTGDKVRFLHLVNSDSCIFIYSFMPKNKIKGKLVCGNNIMKLV